MSVQVLNSNERCVYEALEGAAAVNPGFYLLPNQCVILERDRLVEGSRKKLAIVSGGGSGHEPFVVGYVGRGMLSGGVAGPVFTSPPSSLIANAITPLGKDNPEGVLVIVFNYTGDRVNFGQALERCKNAGIKADMYISGDDCALTKLEGTAGRRGLCGTHFILKIVGAMAEEGASLEEALFACQKIGKAIGTIGVAASGCTLPGAQTPLFSVDNGMLELGLGVHGEAGAKSIKAGSAKEVVQTLLDHMTQQDSASRLDLQKGDEVAVIINNLGTMSQLEMGVITREVTVQLRERGLKPLRVYQGSLMTSLDMKGFHVAILRLLDPQWIKFLDAPTTAPAWPTPCMSHEPLESSLNVPLYSVDVIESQLSGGYTLKDKAECEALRSSLERIIKIVPSHEEKLNHLDSGCGDGDCGSTLIAGITALSKCMGGLPFNQPGKVLSQFSDICAINMGGTSGGLYSILFAAAANIMRSPPPGSSQRDIWVTALIAGTQAVTKYGGASVGDRTMLDAIVPAIEVLKSTDVQDLKLVLKAMAKAADEGAKKTSQMKARAGRASYVRAENVNKEDAGARAIAYVLEAMAEC